MKHSSRFIVLSATKVGDKSLVVHTLSADWGRRSFISGASGKNPMALFLPMSLIEAEVVENPRSDLWRMRGISSSEPLCGIRNDIRKNTMTLFMSEVLMRSLRSGRSDDGMYEWCRKSILMLDALEESFSNFHLLFLLEFAGALGFMPSDQDLAPFAGEHLDAVRRLVGSTPAQALLIPMTGAQRNGIASLLLDYISFHTGSRLEIRSLPVFRELYG